MIVKTSLPAGAWPGQEKAGRQVIDRCERLLTRFFKRNPPSQDLRYTSLSPSEGHWKSNVRTVLCFVVAGRGPLKRPMMP
ncbi:hypothetical protein [Spirillospora sp. NPDC047279]|uniref:hypothetical protein n=1 Tax=Spirillospora sp. NPDC047279 TaxID=3155478 RepID=UPI0033F816B0